MDARRRRRGRCAARARRRLWRGRQVRLASVRTKPDSPCGRLGLPLGGGRASATSSRSAVGSLLGGPLSFGGATNGYGLRTSDDDSFPHMHGRLDDATIPAARGGWTSSREVEVVRVDVRQGWTSTSPPTALPRDDMDARRLHRDEEWAKGRGKHFYAARCRLLLMRYHARRFVSVMRRSTRRAPASRRSTSRTRRARSPGRRRSGDGDDVAGSHERAAAGCRERWS